MPDGAKEVYFVEFMKPYQVVPGVAVTEIRKGEIFKRYIAMATAGTPADLMWKEGNDIVLANGDRFPITAVFRYRLTPKD